MLFLLFFVFTCFSFSQPQLADGIVALVGNQIILVSDVKDEVDLLAQEKQISPNSSLYLDLFSSVLEKNINNKVILNFAKQDSSLLVSYDEIKKILDERVGFYVQRLVLLLSLKKLLE